jgi:FimV-like protein
MKEQLTHILDQSVCLSRKQMKEYLSGSMLPEEVHAAEVHISSCPLCSMAMEGFEEHSEEALAAIASLNSGFLKEHFDNIAPQIHLNSMAPAATLTGTNRRKTNTGAWIRPAGIAAGLLLVCATAWYLAQKSGTQSTTHEFATTTANQPVVVPNDDADNRARASSEATPASAPVTTHAKPAAPEAAAKPAKITVVDKNALARKDLSGTAHYYQPEPVPVEDPAAIAKAAAEALPSVNDPSKTYKGDEISTRTTKKYVPPTYEGDNPLPSATSATKQAAPLKQANSENAAPEPKPAPPKESADQQFERGEYRSALSRYRQQLKSADADTRNHASLQAARCYAAIGEPDRAEALLRKVLDEGNGHERRTARKLLRNLR